MSTDTTQELEFKIVPSDEVQARLCSHNEPDKIVDILKGAFDLGDYKFGTEIQQTLEDVYYDTDELEFYRTQVTLRIRKKGNGEYEITFKSANKKTPGLMNRKETTELINKQELDDLTRNGFHIFLSKYASEYANKMLAPVLIITNSRRTYLLTGSDALNRSDEKYELSLDSFKCERYGVKTNRRARFEIEIEAKSPAAIERLPKIKDSISNVVPALSTQNQSKYEQGIEELGLNHKKLNQFIREIYHAPNFINWLSVLLGVVSILLAILFYIYS